jgi:hypothetical protein
MSDADTLVWTPARPRRATSYRVARGDLAVLRAVPGALASATDPTLADPDARWFDVDSTTTLHDAHAPKPGEAVFYVVDVDRRPAAGAADESAAGAADAGPVENPRTAAPLGRDPRRGASR